MPSALKSQKVLCEVLYEEEEFLQFFCQWFDDSGFKGLTWDDYSQPGGNKYPRCSYKAADFYFKGSHIVIQC